MSSTRKVNKPFLIGVAGGTASGKSTVCRKIMAKLGQDCQRRVALIKQDSFYRQLSNDELNAARLGKFNFDHPDAVDEQAMYQALRDILAGQPVKLPIHDYHDNRPKLNEFNEIQSADVVLFEGVLIFYFPLVRDMFNMKLFVDTDSDTRLSRRVIRDVRERSRPLEIVLDQYDQFVKPAFEEFCQPTKKYADMIIPRGAENEVAIGLINHNVTYLLSSDIPFLKNAHHRPMPLKIAAGSQIVRSSLPIEDSIISRAEQIANVLANCTSSVAYNSNVVATNSPSSPRSPMRSRSGSYASASCLAAAAAVNSANIIQQQKSKQNSDIKE